jgi:hypothetical protein
MIARLIGRTLRIPAVRDMVLRLADREPDFTIIGDDGSEYMRHYTLFNPITAGKRKYPFIPVTIRIHHILRADQDRHPHDHPWYARTWILDGWYVEGRQEYVDVPVDDEPLSKQTVWYRRAAGDTARLGFQQYHRIAQVGDGGAWTLFAFGRYRGAWGFLVDGEKVPFREYAAMKEAGIFEANVKGM